MKRYSKPILLFCIIGLASTIAISQRADVDAMANRNERLELLLIDYKEKLNKANKKLTRLNSENAHLRKDINTILQKIDKSSSDIARLQFERNQLLANKAAIEQTLIERDETIKALEELTKKLQNANQQLKATNSILEQAAMVSDTVQKYQHKTIAAQKESINKLLGDYNETCSEVTGEYNLPLSKDRLEVILEGRNTSPNSSQIENLVVNVCYQENTTQSADRLLMYFTLYKNDKKQVVRHTTLPVPRVNIKNTISYYEGQHHITTTGKYKLEKNATYHYELRYREQIIAKGVFNPS